MNDPWAEARGALRLTIIGMVAAWATGCGQTGPPTYPVEGRVTYRGNPLPRGTVMFVPDEGPPAAAAIAADGTYRTRAVAGGHRVTVTAGNPHPPGVDPTSVANFKPPPPLVPGKFNRPSTSGLTAEIRADSENHVDFDLRD